MKPLLDRLLGHIEGAQKLTLARVPDGFDALILADLTRALARKAPERAATLVMVARDAQRQAQLEAGMAFVAPELEVLTFPNWDCQPYDRVSPNGAIVARRMTVLSRLARSKAGADKPRLLIVTANGLVQRVPRRDKMAAETFSCAPGNMIDIQALAVWLEHHGYLRGPTVRETGEYAVRGGIVDLFPPGLPTPIRLDFFGDTLESIRSFDPETQRSVGQMRALDLVPMSEVQLTSETIKRFRQSYVAQFGAATPSDTLYEAISEGRRYAGLEHWLPLFHDGLDTLFDYIADSPLVLDPLVEEAGLERIASINDHYDARHAAMTAPQAGTTPYKAMPPISLYLDKSQWSEKLGAQSDVSVIRLAPFDHPDSSERLVVDAGGQLSRSFAPERKRAEAGEDVNIFDVVAGHIREAGQHKRVMVAAWSEGARERISGVLHDHGVKTLKSVSRFSELAGLKAGETATVVWGLESGFETDALVVISEQDILGDRLVRRAKRNRRAQDEIA